MYCLKCCVWSKIPDIGRVRSKIPDVGHVWSKNTRHWMCPVKNTRHWMRSVKNTRHWTRLVKNTRHWTKCRNLVQNSLELIAPSWLSVTVYLTNFKAFPISRIQTTYLETVGRQHSVRLDTQHVPCIEA
jgi:hypothetical protein